MIANEKQLENLIDNLLQPLGFLKKKNTWYKHYEETICFFSIDKSPYGGQYGNTFGLFLKGLNITSEQKDYPPYNKSHLRIALHFFVGREITDPLFDLENLGFKSREREDTIVKLIETHALPFLASIHTKSGLKAVVKKYPKLKNYMKAVLKTELGFPPET